MAAPAPPRCAWPSTARTSLPPSSSHFLVAVEFEALRRKRQVQPLVALPDFPWASVILLTSALGKVLRQSESSHILGRPLRCLARVGDDQQDVLDLLSFEHPLRIAAEGHFPLANG